ALTSNAFTKVGYTFSGWNTSADGSGTAYADGANYSFTASITLYAQWTINSYTVTFDNNTGTGTMSNQSANYNTPTALTTNTFTKTGYTFSGWNTAADGSGTAYADGANYNFTASITLYAQWTISDPIISSIFPSSKIIGEATFTMSITGTNFIESSIVRFNGSDRTTTFINDTELTAEIPASDLTVVGSYTITVFNSMPGGGSSNGKTFTVLPLTGTITGLKFHDANANGVKDIGETGIPDWKIKIFGPTNDSAQTNASGIYTFNNVPVGNYVVSEVQQIGWVQTYPTAPGFYSFSLAANQTVSGKDFGNYQLGSISGIKFHDLNGNGSRDAGEEGLTGWKIKLSGTKTDSVLTDVSGHYVFTSLAPGNYVVNEVLQPNWAQTKPGGTGTYSLTVISGQNISGNDFGNFEYNSITGIVFDDLNGNNSLDIGEPGIPNWKLYLSGSKVDTVQTNTEGGYSFLQLAPGAYTVTEELKPTWVQTFPATPGTYSMSVTSGQNLINKNFGNYKQGSISGMKFHDVNGNGIKDLGEGGLENWKIKISGTKNDSQLTDVNGNYSFTALAPGNYVVSEELQPHWEQTVPATKTYTELLVSGQNLTNRIFGNYEFGTITGTVFHDLNSNGTKEIGEPALAGWKLKILGTKTDSVLSNASGVFTFSVPPGFYNVSIIPQLGYVQTTPVGGSYNVGIISGQTVANNNFAFFRYGSISGTVYRDKNGNGARDAGEIVLPNWKIKLNGPSEDSVLTDDNGNYLFLFLFAGTYTISEEMQENWVRSYPANPGTHAVVITSGINAFGKDFGNYELSTVSGAKFDDANGNGIRDGGESGIADWEIRITGAKDDTVFTDENGDYFFEKIPAGNYTISEVQQPNWVQTKPASPGTYTFTVVSEELSGLDFGNYHFGSIGGTVFHDDNGNGVFDTEDYVLENWRIRITGTKSDSLLADANGIFIFDSLPPGNYTVSEVLQQGWGRSLPSSSGTHGVTITSGLIVTGKDFGNYQYASITGTVFEDVNANTTLDAEEPKLSGWKIKISGAKTDSTLSVTDGTYSLGNLPPGDYTVSEVVQSGWYQTTPAEPNSFSVTVTSGITETEKDFGNFQFASISGVIYKDLNKNGSRDQNEGGRVNWSLSLTGSSTMTSVTNSNGEFTFTDLPPGAYSINVVLQPAFGIIENENGVSVSVTTSGSAITDVLFGVYQHDTTRFRTLNQSLDLFTKPTKLVYSKKTNTISPDPNLSTSVENMFKKLGTGVQLTLGIPQLTPDTAKKYGWLAYRKAADFRKLFLHIHDGKSYPIDSNRAGKKAKKLIKGIKADGKKYNNIAWAEGVLFKLNLKASEKNVTPYGFGDLVLDTPATFVGREMQGITLSSIGVLLDSVMTYYMRYGVVNDSAYTALHTFMTTVIKPINERFSSTFTSSNYTVDENDVKVGKNKYGVLLRGVKTATEAGIVKYVFTRNSPLPGAGTSFIIPTAYSLEQNYPNPFNPSTIISFGLPSASKITITVYNSLGQKVATLVDGEILDEGIQEIEFQAEGLSSGVYFYRLDAQEISEESGLPGYRVYSYTKKMMLVK
ncbi:MAG: InlB B-repeat-containing protein, partial [Ignavibacteriales bacterium]|nr:InlB B-repeat-containing protein [Ignavibacteriales bacterium]